MNITNDPTTPFAAGMTTEGDITLGDDETNLDLWPRQAAIPLYSYSAYIILAIGIPGNILTLIVLNSKAYNYSLSTISLNVLAVADLSALLTFILNSLNVIWHVSLRTHQMKHASLFHIYLCLLLSLHP